MDRPSFKDALTVTELRELEKYPDEAAAYALVAFLRSEGALLAGAENLMRNSNNHGTFMLAPRQFYAPPEFNKDTEAVYSKMSGKYDWLEVTVDLSKGNQSGVIFRVKDKDALFKHFGELKESQLLNIKLKRSLLEIGNLKVSPIVNRALEQAYREFGRDETFVAGTKAYLWRSAAKTYLMGYPFEEVCSLHPQTKTRYTTGDVLKAMDADTSIVKQEVLRIFEELDPTQAAPQIQAELAEYKADAAKAESDPDNTHFGRFFQLAEDAGKTAQVLIREREKEARMEKK